MSSSVSNKDGLRSSTNGNNYDLTLQGILEDGLPVDPVTASSFPAFESFASQISQSSVIQHFKNCARVGDQLVVKIKKFDAAGAYVKAICYYTRIKRDLEILDFQLLAPLHALSQRLSIGEYRIATITCVSPIRIELTEVPPLKFSDLPKYFRLGSEMSSKTTFWKFCPTREEYSNPYLPNNLGFPTRSKITFLPLENFEEDCTETAAMMRRLQDEELSSEHVVRGVDNLKKQAYNAAVFEFNRAIQINPKCTDAYVAKGAALSNQQFFEGAEKELRTALEINPDHANAKLYMVETLIKHAESNVSKEELDKARVNYEKALSIKEDKRARAGLDMLEKNKEAKDSIKKRRISDPVKLKPKTAAELEAERLQKAKDRKKLEEMEAFIASLKNGK